MDPAGEMLHKRIVESRIVMNDLFVREAAREAATLDRMAVKADKVMQLVAYCRRSAA